MKIHPAVLFALVALTALPQALVAQAGQPAGQSVTPQPTPVQPLPPPPTGPMTAATRAAAAVRAARVTSLNAIRLPTSAPSNSALSPTTQVMGYLWTANNGAITDARVQLRNMITNVIEGVAQTDFAGQFAFAGVNGGEYVVEYVSKDTNKIIAIGHPFTVLPGETVATFVRLASSVTALVPLRTDLIETILAAVSGLGTTVVVTPPACSDPSICPAESAIK